MYLALTDQTPKFAQFLAMLHDQPFSYANAAAFPQRVTARAIPTHQSIPDLYHCNIDFLFSYDIFPHTILRYLTEWAYNERSMAVGDVIVQQAALPPISYAIRCIFGVRILSITRTATLMGFQYGTLRGHAEMGVSEFALALRGTELIAYIRTYSQPGHRLSRLVAPMFTIPYQHYCTQQALAHMHAAFLQYNPMYGLS